MKKALYILGLIFMITMPLLGQIPTDGLAGYWPFNGNANDESGNGNNGTVNGPILTTDRFGRTEHAYLFNGMHTIITSFQGIGGSGDRTISFWLKKDEEDGGSVVCHYGGGYGTSFNPIVGQTGAGIDISNSTVYFSSGPNNDEAWHHFVYVFSTQYGTSLNGLRIYRDNELLDVIESSYNYSLYSVNSSFDDFTMGSDGNPMDFSLDDVSFYNRVLSPEEITSIFTESVCSDVLVSDTTTYYVSSMEFSEISPWISLESTDSLITLVGNCDSVRNHYVQFQYEPVYCTDTLVFEDTITVYDSISVTDTLLIDAVLTGIDPPNNTNTLKVYPNPAKDHIFVHTGDYLGMNEYQLKIINQLGAIVFETYVEDQLYELNLSNWTGIGIYFLQLIDPGNHIIETRKIILH